MESRILGVLSQLDELLWNPLFQCQSGSAPRMSRNACCAKQGTIEDDSQSDPHPESKVSQNQISQNTCPNGRYGMVTGIHEEITYCSL